MEQTVPVSLTQTEIRAIIAAIEKNPLGFRLDAAELVVLQGNLTFALEGFHADHS